LEAERHKVVGVVHVVELGRAHDLRIAIERGVRHEVQVGEVAELVERNDVGDFSQPGCSDGPSWGFSVASARRKSCSGRR